MKKFVNHFDQNANKSYHNRDFVTPIEHSPAKVISNYKSKKRKYESKITNYKDSLNTLNKLKHLYKKSKHPNEKRILNTETDIHSIERILNYLTDKYQDTRENFNNYEHRYHPWEFYQFNTRITPHLLFLLADRPLALKILAVIMFCAWQKHWGAVILKQKDLRQAVATTKKAGNKNSVNKAIQYLRSLGIIAVSKTDTRNVYIINPKFIWQQPRSKTIRRHMKSHILSHENHIYFEANPDYCRKRGNNGECAQIVNKLLEVRSKSIPLNGSDLKALKPKFTSNKVKPYYKAERIHNHNKHKKQQLKKRKKLHATK